MSSEELGDGGEKGQEQLKLVVRFEDMLNNGNQSFFDVEEFEDIIDYYFEKNDSNKSLQAIDFAINQYPFSTVFFLRKAQIYAAINQSQKALEILSYVESMEPSNTELFMTKGSIYS